jgi:hypothetical protein
LPDVALWSAAGVELSWTDAAVVGGATVVLGSPAVVGAVAGATFALDEARPELELADDERRTVPLLETAEPCLDDTTFDEVLPAVTLPPVLALPLLELEPELELEPLLLALPVELLLLPDELFDDVLALSAHAAAGPRTASTPTIVITSISRRTANSLRAGAVSRRSERVGRR